MTKKLTTIALIGALYTALTFVSAPFSFGAIQLRLSEALCILPLFSPISVLGLTFGCLISNLIGFFTGFNPLGLIDALVGTSATLIGAVLTYLIGKFVRKKAFLYILAPLPPILANGFIVGAELYFLFKGSYLFHFFSVAIGEAIILYILGSMLISVLSKRNIFK